MSATDTSVRLGVEARGVVMSFIMYRVDRRTGLQYAYQQESLWDNELDEYREVRLYLGRVDPETGEIVPSTPKRVPSDVEDLTAEVKTLRLRVAKLEEALRRLSKDALTAIDAAADLEGVAAR